MLNRSGDTPEYIEGDERGMKTILFTGGGTLGPVTPLLSAARLLRERNPEVKIVWIGTPEGPERELVERDGYEFRALKAPKLDRTRIWTLPFIIPQFIVSSIKAYSMLQDIEPSTVVSAGAYVSVPVAFMAKVLGIPVIIEQLDVTPGIANKLMAKVAKKIFVTWPENLSAFPKGKTEVAGGSVRKSMLLGEAHLARERFGLHRPLPTVLIIGGGTGAASMNEMLVTIGPELVKSANVIHLTGKGKMLPGLEKIGDGYHALEFLGESLADAYALADVVVARAGMGTIMEIAALKKPTVLVPIAGSHQEQNAQAVESRNAALVLPPGATPQNLLQMIQKLSHDDLRRADLSEAAGKLFVFELDEKLVSAVECSHDLGNAG
jgi:UDP-N-acetylglucosamine--N-acetylmuramyl-(pentapeptide) pyrophosphoryl-undecaprenol N-acetylglucosamine transferase